jgi:PAT family beta-lactamase induction signal transducer AmpG
MAGTMTIPFILKNGFTKEEYVAIVKVWGLIAVLIGGVFGGVLVHRIGIKRSLWCMGFLQALSTAFFALLSGTDKNIPLLIGVIGFENLTAGMGTSAYAAFMGSMTNIRFSATQYALLSSLMAVPSTIFAARTGALSESLGWSGFFIFCALIALPGMFLIPFLSKSPPKGFLKNFKSGIVILTVLGGIYALSLSMIDLFKLFIN